jgi:hypothetical protein
VLPTGNEPQGSNESVRSIAPDRSKGAGRRGVVERPTTFRPRDGWPLCPSCGDDELYSLVILHWDGRFQEWPPKPEDYLNGQFACYACRWRGYVRRAAEGEVACTQCDRFLTPLCADGLCRECHEG